MTILRHFLLAVIGLGAAAAAFAADPNGTWTFKAEGPDGRTADSTLVLNWKDNRLSGTIDNRAGKAEIKDGSFAGDQVTFTVVREFGRRLRKRTFTTHYSGKLEGDLIKGTIETKGRGDKPVSIPWEAHRVSVQPGGSGIPAK